MGNISSCTPSMISNHAVVKVVFNNGRRLEIYSRAVTAAELMVENPGEFVCDSCNLKVGHRIPGISADEELEPGQLYFLLPIEMLYSVLTIEELSSLDEKLSNVSSKHHHHHHHCVGGLSFSRIFPVFGDFCMSPNSNSKKLVEKNQMVDYEEEEEEKAVKSYSRQRSWKPALETIVETPPHPSAMNA